MRVQKAVVHEEMLARLHAINAEMLDITPANALLKEAKEDMKTITITEEIVILKEIMATVQRIQETSNVLTVTKQDITLVIAQLPVRANHLKEKVKILKTYATFVSSQVILPELVQIEKKEKIRKVVKIKSQLNSLVR